MRYHTMAEAILDVGNEWPTNGFTFQDLQGKESFYAFPALVEEAKRRAKALQDLGLKKGDTFGLIVVEPEDFVLTFLGAMLCGVLPVPLYPPLSFGALDAYARRTAKVLTSANARVLIASEKLQNVLWGLVDEVPSLQKLVKADDLRRADTNPVLPTITPSDIAFLQYTSGSTADPKGVIVTHGNLAANGWAIMNPGIDCHGGRDVAVSWLPLYHDMGLIGFVLSPILRGVPVVFIPTLRFLRHPKVWLETIHQHRGTVTFAPNFAYALAAKKATDEEKQRWDLTSLRACGCGAEPIHYDTMQSFVDTFAPCGLRATSMLPSYGMAEATLAISFIGLDEVVTANVVDAAAFQERGAAVEATDPDAAVLQHVSCGRPFPGHEVAAFSDDGVRLPEGREGELRLRGPSVAAGYFGNPEATAATFLPDGWLRTGDLGYLLNGNVYVTGRLKDLIILNGRNLHPQAVEWSAAEVEGVRKGNVVAFSVPGASSEQLVVVLETREADHARIATEVRSIVSREHGATVSDVVCIAPGQLPKTSSGKLQRRQTRQNYLEGRLGSDGSRDMRSTGDKLTLARHVAKSVWTRARTAVLG